MADLSQYVDFSVLLDKSGDAPVIVIADISQYPTGVAATVTGVLSIVQPDSLSIAGAFTTPDITYDGSVLTTATKELRLASDNNFQKGLYVFSLTVKATGYDDTTKVKTFVLNYDKPEIKVNNLTDVFTPTVEVIDVTDYDKTGYTRNTTWSWSADIIKVGSDIQTITAQSALFDMAYNDNYYDAHYNLSFQSIVTYTSVASTWFSVKDKLTQTLQLDVYAPPTVADLASSLYMMKEQIRTGTYCGGCGCNGYADFEKANSIYQTFVENGRNGNETAGLYKYVLQLQKIFNCNGILNQTHTNAQLYPYDWGVSAGMGNEDRQFIVGSGLAYVPADGDTSYFNKGMARYKPRLVYLNSIADYLTKGADWTPKPGGFDLIGRTFNEGDVYTVIYSGIGGVGGQQFTDQEAYLLKGLISVDTTEDLG